MAYATFSISAPQIVKSIAVLLTLTSTSPILAMQSFDGDSSDSDSEEGDGMNIFRQGPKRPIYDLPMESLVFNFGGLSIETQDCTLYNRALEASIQKSQEIYNALISMLKLATSASSFAFRENERFFFNGELSIYLKQLETILSRKDPALLPENTPKQFNLPDGNIRFIPPINPYFNSLIGANLLSQRDAALVKMVIEYLIPQVDGYYKSLHEERWKLHQIMGRYLNY